MRERALPDPGTHTPGLPSISGRRTSWAWSQPARPSRFAEWLSEARSVYQKLSTIFLAPAIRECDCPGSDHFQDTQKDELS
jgi:hypothetical protein